jgi:hypothetical protein
MFAFFEKLPRLYSYIIGLQTHKRHENSINNRCSDTSHKKPHKNRKIQRNLEIFVQRRQRTSPATATVEDAGGGEDETNTPRLGEAPSQTPLLCGPLIAPAGDGGVAFFGAHRPGRAPSLSEPHSRRRQSTESMENSDDALPHPPCPHRPNLESKNLKI